MGEVASAFVTLAPSAKGFGGKIQKELGGDLDRAGRSSGKRMGAGMSAGIGGAAGKMFAPIAAGMAAIGIGSFFKDAVAGASDLGESGSKVGVVFGKAGDQIMAASKTSATAMGLSQNAYLAATGGLGNLLVSLKIAPKAAADMSQKMVGLAGDLASFNNVAPEEALAALQSGLTGETEPLKKFGINMNDATLKAEAMKQGLIKSTKEAMSPQTKALAAQALIMAQTGTAQGDFARTSGGLANQQRILAAQTEDVKTKIGGALLPVVTTVTTAFNGFITEMQNGKGAGGGFMTILTGVWNSLKPIGTFITGTVIPAIKGLFDLFVGGDFTGGLGKALGVEEDSEIIGTLFSIRDGFMSAFGAVKTFVMTQVMPALMGIVNAVRGFVAVALPIVQQFVAGMMARIGPMMPQIKAVFGQVASIITTYLGLVKAVIERVTTVIAYVWSRWGTQIMDFVAKVFKAVLGVIKPALGVIQAVIKTVTSLIKGDWAGVWNGIKSILSNAWGVIKSVIKLALTVVKGVLSAAWALIKAGASAAWGGIKRAIASALDGIKSAVAGKIREAVAIVSGVKGKITSALSGAATWLTGVGRNIVSGLISGIGVMTNAVGNALVGLMPGPLKAFARKLLIHSPSRVFIKFGQFIGQGLIVGIKGTQKQVTSATKQLATQVAAVFTQRYKGKGKAADYGAQQGANLMRRLSSTTSKLASIATARDRVAVKLKAAQTKLAAAVKVRNDFAANVKENVLAFGSVTAVNPGDIVEQLRARLEATKEFVANMAKLTKSGLNKAAFQQLVDAGVEGGGAAAAALVEGGKSAVTSVNSLQSQLATQGAALGKVASTTLFQAGVDSANGLVKGLESQTKALAKSATKLANQLVKALRRALGIKSPSSVMAEQGVFTAAGLIKGIESQRGEVAAAFEALVKIPRSGSLDFASPSARANAVNGAEFSLGSGNTFYSYDPSALVAEQRKQALDAVAIYNLAGV